MTFTTWPRFHEWLYAVVDEVCYDRDYTYALYAEHFNALTGVIFGRGHYLATGRHTIIGLKSDLAIDIRWQLEHQLDLRGPNQLLIEATLRNRITGAVQCSDVLSFDLATGACLSHSAPRPGTA